MMQGRAGDAMLQKLSLAGERPLMLSDLPDGLAAIVADIKDEDDLEVMVIRVVTYQCGELAAALSRLQDKPQPEAWVAAVDAAGRLPGMWRPAADYVPDLLQEAMRSGMHTPVLQQLPRACRCVANALRQPAAADASPTHVVLLAAKLLQVLTSMSISVLAMQLPGNHLLRAFKPLLAPAVRLMAAVVRCEHTPDAAGQQQQQRGSSQQQPYDDQQAAPPCANPPNAWQKARAEADEACLTFSVLLTRCGQLFSTPMSLEHASALLVLVAQDMARSHQQQGGRSALLVPHNPAQRGRSSAGSGGGDAVTVQPDHEDVLRVLGAPAHVYCSVHQRDMLPPDHIMGELTACIVLLLTQHAKGAERSASGGASARRTGAHRAPAGPLLPGDVSELVVLSMRLALEALLLYPLQSVKSAALLVAACASAFVHLYPGKAGTDASAATGPAAARLRARCWPAGSGKLDQQLLRDLLPRVVPALLHAARQHPGADPDDVAQLHQKLGGLIRAWLSILCARLQISGDGRDWETLSMLVEQHPLQCLASLELAIRDPRWDWGLTRATRDYAEDERRQPFGSLMIVSVVVCTDAVSTQKHSLLSKRLLQAAAEDARPGLLASVTSLLVTCLKVVRRGVDAAVSARAVNAVVSVGAAMQQHISTRLSAIQGEPGLVSNGPVAAATATSASSVSPGHAAASIACAAQGLTAVQAEVQRLLHNSLCFTAPMLSGLSSVCLHRVPQDTDDEHKLAQAQMAFATSTLGFTPYCSADALVTDGQPAALASVLAASKKMDARSRELLRQLQAPSAGPQVVKQLGKYLQAASALSDSMAAISCRTDSVCQNPQCTSLQGASEVQAATLRCAACRQVVYCSTACQRAHWAQHKRRCARCATEEKAAATV